MMEGQKRRDIRNILAVFCTAIISAGILAAVFLYYYGPSGRYLAGHTLLDPSLIQQINYQDPHPRTGKKVHFTFDHIEFSYFESRKGVIRIPAVPLERYQQFYNLVAFEKSLEQVTAPIQDLFLRSSPSLLTIKMRTMEGEKVATKIFQVVQFVEEDYFRVQLHQANEGEWAYFYRPGLYQEIIRLFTQAI